jgi:hypothetical protein
VFCSICGLIHLKFFNSFRIYTLNAEECSKREKSVSDIRECVCVCVCLCVYVCVCVRVRVISSYPRLGF